MNKPYDIIYGYDSELGYYAEAYDEGRLIAQANRLENVSAALGELGRKLEQEEAIPENSTSTRHEGRGENPPRSAG